MDMERTAAVAVPAREAVLRGFFQRQIVFARQIVAELCQIVILVDQRNVESGRTRMAVLAVDAGAERGGSCKRGSFGIVALLRSRFKIGKDLAQLLFAAVAGKDGENAGLVERIGDALRFAQRLFEGGLRRVEQLPAAEGLHDRNADALFLAAAVKIIALGVFAEGKLAPAVVVDGVDAEHQHVDDAHVQHAVCKTRCVRGKTEMAHDTLPLQVLQIAQNAVFLICAQVGFFIQTVDEAEVDVVRLQVFQLPGDGALDFVQLGGPAVFACGVVRAEVDLQEDLPADVLEGFSVGGENACMSACHVKIVDAKVEGGTDGPDDVRFFLRADHGRAHADDADLFAAMGENSVFHMYLRIDRILPIL